MHFKVNQVLLNRRVRRELIQFLEALWLYVQGGYELAFGWSKVLESGAAEVSETLRHELTQKEEVASFTDLLGVLGSRFSLKEYRIWFQVLRELYTGGAGLSQFLEAMINSLREAERLEIELHCRRLPSRISIATLLFFLPPAMMLLFVPLTLELIHSLD